MEHFFELSLTERSHSIKRDLSRESLDLEVPKKVPATMAKKLRYAKKVDPQSLEAMSTFNDFGHLMFVQ